MSTIIFVLQYAKTTFIFHVKKIPIRYFQHDYFYMQIYAAIYLDFTLH